MTSIVYEFPVVSFVSRVIVVLVVVPPVVFFAAFSAAATILSRSSIVAPSPRVTFVELVTTTGSSLVAPSVAPSVTPSVATVLSFVVLDSFFSVSGDSFVISSALTLFPSSEVIFVSLSIINFIDSMNWVIFIVSIKVAQL